MIQAFQRLSLTSTHQVSSQLQNCSPIDKIESLVITNFKSFKGTVYVGPLLDFTSIVGPNGAGKSNVLDALMFCFCNQKNKMHFFDVRQFITREGTQTYNEMMRKGKFCEVEAKFRLQNGRVLTISRKLSSNEDQLFKINGQQYVQKTYENFLIKHNINFITSNFAVWQGEIDKFLLKSPKDLTNHIETVSGSTFFKKQQEQLKNQIKGVQEYIESRSLRLGKLRQEKKHIKSLKTYKNQSIESQNEYEQILKLIYLMKAYQSEMEVQSYEKEMEKRRKQEKKKIEEVNMAKVQIQKQQMKRVQLESKIKRGLQNIAGNYTLLKNSQQMSSVIDNQDFSSLSKEIQSLKSYYDRLNERKRQLQKEIDQQGSNDINKEYLQLFNEWSKKNQAINNELKKRKEEYLYTEGILQSKRNIMQEFNQKQVKMQGNVQDELKQKKQMERNIVDIQNKISKMKVESSKMVEQFSNSKRKIEDMQQKINKCSEQIIDLQSLVTDSLDNEKQKQLLMKLIPIQGFKGMVSEWVKPANKKYEVCFKMMMGSVLKYLLCSDQSSSKHITVRLRENYQIKNLIILSNVQEKKELVTRATLGKYGSLAVEAIEFDKNLTNFELFLKDFLNGKVICENLAAAWKIIGQNIRGVKDIYTLDGNVLGSDGVVSSYGSVELGKNNYKYINTSKNTHVIMQQMQGLKNEKQKLQGEMKVLKKRRNDEELQKHTIQVQRLEAKKTEFQLKVQFIKRSTEKKKQEKVPKGLEKQIDELQRRVQKLKFGMQQIERQMLKSKIFSTFVNKNKIDGLDNLRAVQDISSLEASMKHKLKIMKQFQQTEGQVHKIVSQINQKEQKYKRLKDKIQNVKTIEEQKQLKRSIQDQQQELTSMRMELSQLKNVNLDTLTFKSQLHHMEAKLSVMKERHLTLIKEEAQNLGLPEIPELDYSFLEQRQSINLKNIKKDTMERVSENLEIKRVNLEKEMEKNNIGLADFKVNVDDEKTVQEEITRITEHLKEANSNKNELIEKIDRVKEDRKAVFMDFMNELKPILQSSYETLTQKSGSVGRATIFMENEGFPCDEGLYYSPVPPTKRFVYDLGQLSGGQKSVASLALQYSIAMASKSPFLILDETDAFLDAENTKRFMDLIRRTLSDKKLQFVVITHKKGIFEEGDSLVGLTKPKDDPFSKAFSLKLNDPDDEEEDVGEDGDY